MSACPGAGGIQRPQRLPDTGESAPAAVYCPCNVWYDTDPGRALLARLQCLCADDPMRLLRIASLAFVTGFSGAVMPGTMLVLTIGQVSVHGFWAAPAIVLGHALLELVVVLALIAGLRHVLANPRVRGGVGIVGGVALIYMGFDMLRGAMGVQIELTRSAEALPLGYLVLQGAAVCIVNPYFTAWWATIGVGQMAHLQPRNAREYLAFYLAHEASDLVWYSFVGIVVVLGAKVLNLAALVIVCGALVAVLGGWFIYTGIQCLRGAPTGCSGPAVCDPECTGQKQAGDEPARSETVASPPE